jgi:hypothetical protein
MPLVLIFLLNFQLGFHIFAWAGLDCNLPTYNLLHICNHRYAPLFLACGLRWVLSNFLFGTASSHNLPDLCLPSSWEACTSHIVGIIAIAHSYL